MNFRGALDTLVVPLDFKIQYVYQLLDITQECNFPPDHKKSTYLDHYYLNYTLGLTGFLSNKPHFQKYFFPNLLRYYIKGTISLSKYGHINLEARQKYEWRNNV